MSFSDETRDAFTSDVSDELTRSIKLVAREIYQLKLVIRDKISEINEAHDSIVKKAYAERDAAEETEKAPAGRDVSFRERKEALAGEDSALGERKKALAERDAALDKTEKALAERDAAHGERKKALAERDTALCEIKKALAERDAAHGERKRALAERDIALCEFKKAHAERDAAHRDSGRKNEVILRICKSIFRAPRSLGSTLSKISRWIDFPADKIADLLAKEIIDFKRTLFTSNGVLYLS
jgi:uncharacterized protein (DUF3084 family)